MRTCIAFHGGCSVCHVLRADHGPDSVVTASEASRTVIASCYQVLSESSVPVLMTSRTQYSHYHLGINVA